MLIFFSPKGEKLITENKWYQNTTHNGADWKWQGSNDASNWTTLDSWTAFSTNCSLAGCMDTLACNYNPLATLDDSSCVFPLYVSFDLDNNSLLIYNASNDPLTFGITINSISNISQEEAVQEVLVYLENEGFLV